MLFVGSDMFFQFYVNVQMAHQSLQMYSCGRSVRELFRVCLHAWPYIYNHNCSLSTQNVYNLLSCGLAKLAAQVDWIYIIQLLQIAV